MHVDCKILVKCTSVRSLILHILACLQSGVVCFGLFSAVEMKSMLVFWSEHAEHACILHWKCNACLFFAVEMQIMLGIRQWKCKAYFYSAEWKCKACSMLDFCGGMQSLLFSAVLTKMILDFYVKCKCKAYFILLCCGNDKHACFLLWKCIHVCFLPRKCKVCMFVICSGNAKHALISVVEMQSILFPAV